MFGKASGIIKLKERPKWELNDRLINVVKKPRLLPELSGKNINVKEMKEVLEAYPDFLSSVYSTTLIRSPIGMGKTKVLRGILNSLTRNKKICLVLARFHIVKLLAMKLKLKLKYYRVWNFVYANIKKLKVV